MSFIVCLSANVTMQWRAGTGSPPYILECLHPASSSSTPETSPGIIQEGEGIEKHIRDINPTLITHFEYISKHWLFKEIKLKIISNKNKY